MFKTEGELLKHLIKNRGYTQNEFAVALGIARQTLVNLLGKAAIPDEYIPTICAILHIRPEELKIGDVSNVHIVHEDGVPYYPVDVAASNINVFDDSPEVATMRISIPGFEDCQLALPVFGHSMYPTYDSGCIIICKKIEDLDVISYGEAHLVITKEQRLLKRLRKSELAGHVLLDSDNYEAKDKEGKRRYEPFDIAKNKIRHLYLVKGSIKRNQM